MIYPVILSGGAGARLWPASLAERPKQFLRLLSDFTVFEETLLRVNDSQQFAPPMIITQHEHRALVAEGLLRVGVRDAEIVLEPVARNTAPAIAVAALLMSSRDPDAVLLVLPSDHVIRRLAAFQAAINVADKIAHLGRLIMFGITADRPHTGFGYMKQGAAVDQGANLVARFVEKPAAGQAKAMLAEGGWFWNSGMFAFTARVMIGEMEKLAPDVLAAARDAIRDAKIEDRAISLDAESFARAPAVSIDYVIMERTTVAAMVPADIGWNDLGTWDALWHSSVRDCNENVLRGEVLTDGVTSSYVSADGIVIAVLGLRDVVVVGANGAVLVAERSQTQRVKELAERLNRLACRDDPAK